MAIKFGGNLGAKPDAPHDADDFGRCYLLLTRFPEWLARLPEVAAAHPIWERPVALWTELSKAFEQKEYVRVNALLVR